MARMKEIFIEMQERYGEDVEITEVLMKEYLKEKGIYVEKQNKEEEE